MPDDLQALKRAMIVGETTGGGAHGTTIYRITDHFSLKTVIASKEKELEAQRAK